MPESERSASSTDASSSEAATVELGGHTEASLSSRTWTERSGDSLHATSGVSTAHGAILASEEHARTMALFRIVVLVGIAGMIAVWLPAREAPGRLLAFVGCASATLVSGWLLFDQADPRRFDARKVFAQGMVCVFATLVTAYYVGVFSPAILPMFIGIYFFASSDDARAAMVISASAAVGYLVLASLAIFGVIDTRAAVVALADPDPVALSTVAIVTEVLFALTFWIAHRTRAATRAAFERLERAARQISKRDALLDEARAQLDHQRAAKLGRFTDQQVGNYVVGEVIGRGAMGEVYQGSVVDSSELVALKFLNPALLGDSSKVERFLREAELTRRLDSRHVVQVMDSGVAEGGTPFIVMELLRGRDLSEHLRKRGRLSMTATVELVSHVSRALEAAHDAGIVHRDLKPQNLFRAEDGGRRSWKVLDFGVSKLLAEAKNLTLGAAVGTPSYMSPEQARGQDVDGRADIFALGVVAYRALTGRPAFTGADSVSTIYNVVNSQPTRPSDLVKLSQDVERVLALALAKQLERRFSSAKMFATALEEAARERLDERLRRDADELLAEEPWGSKLSARKAS